MPIADHLYRVKKRLHKLAQGFGKRQTGEQRVLAEAFNYLQSKDARVYKRIDGITLVQYPDHIAGSLLDGKLWGLRDFELALAILRPRLSSGAFIDVGANSGMISIYAAHQNLFTKIVAIEPLQANYELLCVNLRLNDVANAVPIQCAVSDREGEARMPLNRLLSGSGFAYAAESFELVQMRPLDNLLEDNGIDAASIALVWMSIRGHENVALHGMTQILAAQVPLLVYFTPLSEPASTIALLQRHYQHCASWKNEEPRPTASLDPENFKQHTWLAVW